MNGKRKIIILSIICAMILTLSGVGMYYWYNNTYFVSTEDAKVTGDFVKVMPEISGKLLEFSAEEGDKVIKDQIIGRMEAVGITDGSMETSLLRAPISGIIVKKQGEVGELCTAGSILAMIVDTSKLYITANIEETKLENIKPGEKVDVKIDQFKGKTLKGKVKTIGKASNSAFSLLPSSSSGNFTKVVQKIPVKIDIEESNLNLVPATNADIKIHIK